MPAVAQRGGGDFHGGMGGSHSGLAYSTVAVFWGQDFAVASLTVDLGASTAVSFQGTAFSSALAFPVTGLITARDGVIIRTDTATILTPLTRILTITQAQMIIHPHILIRTHMFFRTHTPMFIRHVK
jgi:hypothetical protein